ncbi:unnamed protein product [Polarella glacialis]|uniref:Nuclear pore protein n=1 Tax=Polarella glacialis TaxID=89957 RepID=A0A813ILN7_POLGL|nr:unnamed protein product [Polarella glacialis]
MSPPAMDVKAEGLRQLERAERLLDVGSSMPRGARAPVHKSLEQLFGEARVRSQTIGSIGSGAFGTSGLPRLLQSPQAQRLEKQVADFSLTPAPGVGAGVGGLTSTGGQIDDHPSLGLKEFFALRHERVILETVEEAQRDCLRSCERHSFERIQADWEDAKAQILSSMSPQRLGHAAVALALQGNSGNGPVSAASPQDGPIIDLMLAEPMSQQLVQRVAQLSCASCPAYSEEVMECWNILGQELKSTPGAVTCGSIWYLQTRFAQEVKDLVYHSADSHLGGIPDAWSLVRAWGRTKFDTANFPSTTAHVWYAAFVAARAGFVSLLMELPQRAAPCADRCPMLRAVCTLMAQRLQSTTPACQPSPDFAAGSQEVDSADLLRADLAEESNGFHDVLVSLLLGRSFAFGRLPEATVEDWIWYRLHSVHISTKGDDQSPEFSQQFEAFRQQAASLPPSHYDPAATGGPSTSGIGSMEGSVALAATASIQTLNFVKVLLLTAQFGRALQQLASQDRSLRGVSLHMALVLQRAGTLDALAGTDTPLNVSALLCDYAANFSCRDQLQYFRALDLPDRVQALQKLLLRGGAGASDELLGYIDGNGRHRPGLLERTLQEDGMGDQAEFVDLCARSGRQACQQGQYREAIRLLHFGRCFSEVLHVLCRCLRLPIWREEVSSAGGAAQDEAAALAQDIQRFFAIYERNLDRYALSSQVWGVARKLYGARMFHALCDRGQPEAALDVFDREQLLPFSSGPAAEEYDDEVWTEYPRIVSDYVRILRHAAGQGTVATMALQERVRQLQSFLAVRCTRLVLGQETSAALAGLALCC